MTPSDLRYERYAPGPALADYIEHFWIVTATVGAVERREILVPNGRPTIIVNLGDAGHRLDPLSGSRTVNGSGVSGISTRPIIIAQSGFSKLVAAQPTPYGLNALGCASLVDRTLSLADWCGPEEAGRLQQAVETAEFGEPAARILEAFLMGRLDPVPPVDLIRLKTVIAAIERDDDLHPLSRLAGDMNVDYDRIYRAFRKRVGISPKIFATIIRYQKLVGRLLGAQPGDGLAQLALLQGYYDQAHANRDFRRFTGVTPTIFRQTLSGIARMMHQI